METPILENGEQMLVLDTIIGISCDFSLSNLVFVLDNTATTVCHLNNALATSDHLDPGPSVGSWGAQHGTEGCVPLTDTTLHAA